LTLTPNGDLIAKMMEAARAAPLPDDPRQARVHKLTLDLSELSLTHMAAAIDEGRGVNVGGRELAMAFANVIVSLAASAVGGRGEENAPDMDAYCRAIWSWTAEFAQKAIWTPGEITQLAHFTADDDGTDLHGPGHA
jgi:hypothetical protein